MPAVGNIKLIATALVRAEQENPRKSSFSLQELHDNWGAPSPEIADLYLTHAQLIAPIAYALHEAGWKLAPPTYSRQTFLIRLWNNDEVHPWMEYIKAQEKVSEIEKKYLTDHDDATHAAIEAWNHWRLTAPK